MSPVPATLMRQFVSLDRGQTDDTANAGDKRADDGSGGGRHRRERSQTRGFSGQTGRMAQLKVDDGRITIELSGWEKAGAIRRSDVSIPLSSVSAVRRLDNTRDGIRGMRAPGTGFPGVIALGSWRTRRTVDFVAVTRNEPGYVIDLHGERFDRLVISSPPIPELEELVESA